MQSLDLLFTANWWLLFFIIGFCFLPFSIYIFHNFFDRGYIFSKIISAIITSYLIFILGVTHIAQFTRLNSIIILLLLTSANYFLYPYLKTKLLSLKPATELFKRKWKIFVFEELLFVAGLFFWSYIRNFQPDINGLEKFMDFGFVNSILRSDYFPPKDMWFTPFSINYYYFGHLITAVLTKISGIPSQITYNLMLATLFAFTFAMSFSIGVNLIYRKFESKISNLKILLGGLLTAFLVSLGGNLHPIYTFFKPYPNENPVPFWQLIFSPQTFPNAYWYPNATRFIYNTIHEFPIYSFVVSDLHGHVLGIPIILTIIALLLNEFLSQRINIKKLVVVSFLIAAAYMTNAWDGAIYALLSIIVLGSIIFLNKELLFKTKLYELLKIIFIIVICFFIFSLPFNIFFKPFASGIGVLCAPKFLTDIGKIGPFLFEADHCQKSPIWQLSILYGFFYFWAIAFIIVLFKKIKSKHEYRIPVADFFTLILISISTLLIIVPEFIYIKDIYPAHYRANTMFKLVYQAFIMLSLSSGYIIFRLISNFTKNLILVVFVFIGSIGLFLIAVYPYFAINSYYGNLQITHGLDGTRYLKKLYPTDYEAILWINKNIKNQPVILEAQGDSYTNYARVSANTGLPTVLGWTVHEWLWRGTYDIPAPRINEVKELYEMIDIDLVKQLIDKYKISYVFVGDLEREKYPALYEDKFSEIGKIVYENGQTRIYKINSSLN
ncbi:MAG: DUF2298 domain-containing protein [Patescibacteria group bacterium]|nr:DUF2298 domain-containing protein [Patescibacteria group bacterium]